MSNVVILEAALAYCEEQLAKGKTHITVWELIELGILPCVERKATR